MVEWGLLVIGAYTFPKSDFTIAWISKNIYVPRTL